MKDWSVKQVKAERRPGRWRVSRNLYLQVLPAAAGDELEGDGADVTRSWLFRYMHRGRQRWMGLGPVRLVSLAEARDEVQACQRQLLKGIDPLEARREASLAAIAAAAGTMTFKECATAYIAAHAPTWRNPKHRQQWGNTLSTYVYPTIGKLPVEAVTTALVMRILEPIWQAKPETAGRVRGRIETVLAWAGARRLRQGDNPARWRGHLDQLLPRRSKVRKVRHQPAMPYAKVPAFVAKLRGQPGISARALEFTILCTVRTVETIGGTWPEIDRGARVWTVPAERTKAGREHRVPLSDRALEILDGLPREEGNPHLFIGARKGKGLSNMAMLELLREMAPGYTVHGFRSSFRDWCAERTAYPRELAEVALAHALKDKTEAAYQRGDLLERRRRLMREWAQYCALGPSAEGMLLEFGARR